MPTSARGVRQGAGDFHEQLHAMDYLVYAYLQLGQDKKAKAVVDEMKTVTGFTETALPGPYALAASPARYAVERGDWKAAAALEVRPARCPTCRRSPISPARSVLPARAIRPPPRPTSPSLSNCGTSCQAKDAYWSEQVDIQRQVAAAWVLYAEGKHDEALKAMSAAADAEDKTEKHPVTPGVPKPARESMARCCSIAAWPRRRSPPSRRR